LSFLMDVLTQFRQGMQEEWSQARREGVEHGNTSMALLTEFQHRMREEWSQARREGADQLGVAIQDMRQQISACREEGGSTRQLAITTSEEVGNFKQAVEGLMASTQALARKITPLPKSTGD
jgi:predicted phage tail protein